MAKRTLVKEKSDKLKFMEDIVLAVSTPKSDIVDIQSDWIEEPASLEVFCTDYLEESLFPIQQKFGSDLLGNNGYEFDEKYTDGIAFWGKGCVSGNTVLEDANTGDKFSIKYMAENNISIDIKSLIISLKKKREKYKITTISTGVPFKKGTAKLYKIKTKNGQEVTVSEEHKFLTQNGWKMLKELSVGDKIMTNNSKKEILRREKISKSMKNIPKTKEHIKNMKQADNSSRFIKGHIPANLGITPSQKVKDKISKKLTGRKLSDETRKKMSIANKGLKHHKSDCPCLFCKTKRGEFKVFRKKNFTYAGKTMRSSWEVKFAKHLDEQGIIYEYEPRSFQISNGTRYIPDFYLPTENLWIEIKGRLERVSEDKMNLFIKEYDLNFIMLRHFELKEIGVL